MHALQLKYTIYLAVEANPDISKKRLAWALSTILEISEETINQSIEEMMRHSQELVRCFNYFTLPKGRTRKKEPVVLLRIDPKTRDIVESIFSAHQKINKYEVQSIKIGGNKNGGDALQKVGATSAVPYCEGR